MQALAAELRLERFSFDGALTGRAKLDAYSSASVYALPTHAENFGLTVAEALASGTPTIVTKGAPWSGIVANRCGWWIDHGVDPLYDALAEATTLAPAELAEMGVRGRTWVEREFCWDSIADRMLATYEWILAGMPDATTPSWVDRDGGGAT
jgi:glycosyltransferase involved in cell wall biosynthesis